MPLHLFNDLPDAILTDKTLESKSQEDEDNENENENENVNENEDDDKTMSQNKIIKKNKWCFRWNNWQIKIIWRANKIVRKMRRSK